MIDLFKNEAAILIEDEDYIESFVIDGNSGILKLMICFVFNLLSSSPKLNNDLYYMNNDQNDHFWLFFEKYHENDICIIYINSLKIFQTFNEKAYIWILLEFSQMNIDSLFEKALVTNKLQEYYEFKENILLTHYIKEVIQIFSVLKKINYKINLEICENYKNYLKTKNFEKTTMIFSDYYINYQENNAINFSPINLMKNSSLDRLNKSNFRFIKRGQNFETPLLNFRHKTLSNSLSRNATQLTATLKDEKHVTITPFHGFSVKLNIQKQAQILFHLKKTLQTIYVMNYDIINEIKATYENFPFIAKASFNKNNPIIANSIVDSPNESIQTRKGSKNYFYGTFDEDSYFKESPLGKNLNLKFYTPEANRTKPRIIPQLSIEKNLSDYCKNCTVFNNSFKSESADTPSIINDKKKKKNSERLYEEIYLNNDSKFQEKPNVTMKVFYRY